MPKIPLIKTTPFKLDESNKHHVFDVEFNGDTFVCVFPAPIAEQFAAGFENETDAWIEILTIRSKYASAKQWKIADTDSCFELLTASLNAIHTDNDGYLLTGWAIFEEGTDIADIHQWLHAELGL